MKTKLMLVAALLAAPAWAADPAPSDATPAAPAVQEPAADVPAASELAAPVGGGSVARAQFTSAVEQREPTDNVGSLTNDKTSVYYFSEIRDAAGQRITHRWEYNGKTMAEVGFDIGGNRWRVHSSKNLDPSWLGEWKVSVLDATGVTLSVNTFTYEAAPKAEVASPMPPPSEPASAPQPTAPTN